MILHRAPFVVPVSRPLIVDGGVLVDRGIIQAVGRFSELRPGAALVVDHAGTIITPPLVNCHCHLELAHLAELGQGPVPENFTGWVRELVQARLEKNDADYLRSARGQLAALEDSGVGLLADIGNLAGSAAIGGKGKTRVIFLRELLGLSQAAAQENIRLSAREATTDFTAHAPYSCAAWLIKELKDRAGLRKQIFSIHAAESLDEQRFLADAGGPLRDFVEDKGVWDNSFRPPGCGSIEYLDRLGVLDDKTLCVHCVQVSKAETELLAASRARVCLCPGSNEFFGLNRAPVGEFLELGIRPGLGTDSLASNRQSSIWEEMRILRQQHPALDPAHVFAMATRNGARALGVDNYGVLEPGAAAAMLAVSRENGLPAEIFEFLTTTGKNIKVQWIR
jgi:cytosine/adenosine deaminase-related metal-dependent hydrolase